MTLKNKTTHNPNRRANARKWGIHTLYLKPSHFLGLGVAYLTCGASPSPHMLVSIPFVPGIATTLDWQKDLRTDRVRLETCEPLTELARSSRICESIFASGEQRTVLVLGERTEPSAKPQLGFTQPRAVIQLAFENKLVEVEFVPFLPFTNASAGTVANASVQILPPPSISQQEQNLVCAWEQPELNKAIVSRKWVLRRKKHDFPYEFEGEKLPLSAIAGQNIVECQLLLFNGTLLQKSVAQSTPEALLRSAQEAATPTPVAKTETKSSEAESPFTANPSLGAPSFVYFPSGTSTTRSQIEAFLPAAATPLRWTCRSNSPTLSCKLDGGARSRKLVLSSAGNPPPETAVTVQLSFEMHQENFSVEKTIPVFYDSELVKSSMPNITLEENPAGTFHCKKQQSDELPQDVLWFRNGVLVPEWRQQKTAHFTLPLNPEKVGCIWVGAERGLLTAAAAENTFMPKAPSVLNLPSSLIVMPQAPTRFAFDVDKSQGDAHVTCSAQNEQGQSFSFCKEETTQNSELQRFSFSDGAQVLSTHTFNPPVVKVAIKTEHGTFLKHIDFENLHNVSRPHIIAVWAHKEKTGEGHCLFAAHDPNNQHFTVRVQWQDDPGRVQDFSTFLRNETTTLVPADVFFHDASLKPKHLLVGEAILNPIAGRPSCKVIASNGVLFVAKKSRFQPNAREAHEALFSAAKQASIELKTPQNNPHRPKEQNISSSNTPSKLFIFRFRAGENWETPLPASQITSCTGHDAFCLNTTFKNKKLTTHNTTLFAPGRAFLTLKKSSGDSVFALVEIQNTAFAGHRINQPTQEPCPTLIKKLLAGDIAAGTLVSLTLGESQKVPLANFTSLSATEQEEAACAWEQLEK